MTTIHMQASWNSSIDGTTTNIPCGTTVSVQVTERRADVTCTACQDVLAGRTPTEQAEVEAPRSTEACWIAIYNHATPGTWTKLADIKAAAGLTQDELERGIRYLLAETDDVELEAECHGRRVTAEMREAAVVVGGEARHLVRLPE